MDPTKAIKGLTAAAAIAIPLIVISEGIREKAYLDPPGNPTICYGHTKGVKLGDVKTKEECVVLLAEDVRQKEAAVDRLLKVEVSPYVKAALIDFAYNAGEGALAQSSMLRYINAGNIRAGCEAFTRCTTDAQGRKSGWGCGFAGGVQYSALIKRRVEERDLCLKGVDPCQQ